MSASSHGVTVRRLGIRLDAAIARAGLSAAIVDVGDIRLTTSSPIARHQGTGRRLRWDCLVFLRDGSRIKVSSQYTPSALISSAGSIDLIPEGPDHYWAVPSKESHE